MIKVQLSDGNGETWVNLNKSVGMTREKERTCIHFDNPDNYVYVEETPEQIISAWEEYQLSFEWRKTDMRLSEEYSRANR